MSIDMDSMEVWLKLVRIIQISRVGNEYMVKIDDSEIAVCKKADG